MSDSDGARQSIEALHPFGPVLAIKLYRLTLDPTPAVPLLPCLDHEAMLHELVFIPASKRIEVDTVSTWGENSPASHQRLLDLLRERFRDHSVRVKGPSWWRGERRVAHACRADALPCNPCLA